VLELEGLLRITGEKGETIDLTGEGSRLRADIGSLSVRRPTLRLVRSSLVLVRRLARLLTQRKLTLLVTRGVHAICGGVVERLLRMPRVRIFRRK
jgi:hypothetical protein